MGAMSALGAMVTVSTPQERNTRIRVAALRDQSSQEFLRGFPRFCHFPSRNYEVAVPCCCQVEAAAAAVGETQRRTSLLKRKQSSVP